MASKYAGIIKTLPRLSQGMLDDPKWRDRVDARKREIVNADPLESAEAAWLVGRYARLRAAKKELEETLGELNLDLEAFTQLLVEKYDAAGITTLRLDTGESVWNHPEPYAVVKDRDAVRRWAVDNGLESQLGLPWQTLNAITKERLLAGDPPPDGVEAFVKDKIVFKSK